MRKALFGVLLALLMATGMGLQHEAKVGYVGTAALKGLSFIEIGTWDSSSGYEIVRGEGWPSYLQAAGLATVPLAERKSFCTATVFRRFALAFAVTAGHCTVMEEPELLGLGPVVLAEGFPLASDDIAVFLPRDEETRLKMLEVALDFPFSPISWAQGEELTCLAYEFLQGPKGDRFQLVPLYGKVGPLFSFAEIHPKFYDWETVYLFSGTTWPGNSGSICYGQDGLIKALVVGGKSVMIPTNWGGVRVPIPPGVLEGPEALEVVGDWLASR